MNKSKERYVRELELRVKELEVLLKLALFYKTISTAFEELLKVVLEDKGERK
jgi:hypothetical protein